MKPFIAPNILMPAGDRRMPIRFGVPSDADGLKSWRAGRGHTFPAAAKDAVEYAKLASKRWRYYSHRDEVARTMAEFESRVGGGTKSEVGFDGVVPPDLVSPSGARFPRLPSLRV
ncbi:MAG TPA: hypothetical protein DDZ88_20030 [Verrucomicrobiales bacterium]|nr:hypothetical protein [Verrucomicrobiales bacterium]